MAIDSFQELRFVQHLFGRIKDELTGRSVAEILTPCRELCKEQQ